MSTIALNGQIVVSGSVFTPPVGAWVADVVLAAAGNVPSACELTIGDLTLNGTVFRTAAFAGSRSARIVGGAGGWRKRIPRRGYSHDAGVLASTVLIDAAREAGETIVVDSDRQLGSSWAREDNAKAERTLRFVTGGQWWIDPAGVTQTKARDSSLITSPFTAIAWSGGKGHFEIATENYADWQPGRTFTATNVMGTQTVSTVRAEATNEGKLRLIVLSTMSEADRALAAIRELVRSELAAVRFAAEWEYTVAPSAGLGLSSSLDLVSPDPSMPDLTNVSLAPGNVESPPMAGTKCRVRFVNANPGRPEVVSMSARTEHLMTTEATALLIYNTLAALMTAAGGGPLLAVVLQPLIGAAIAAAIAAPAAPVVGMIAQGAAQIAATASMLTGAPAVATGTLIDAAIKAALATKALDVTGYCPSVGVPNGA